jgi:glycosyltransferase involved in cell wall biosynthesis
LGTIAARLVGRTRSIVRQGLKITPKNDFKRRTIFRLADCVVVNAEEIRRDLLQHAFVDERKLRVLHNGVDLQRFTPGGDRTAMRRELGISDAASLVGSVGSLSGQKGYEHLIEAARALPHVTFVVLGEGTQRQQLEAQARAAGVSNRFLLPGFRADVRPFLAALDLFVLSSVNEGMARVLLEAMACGLPLVATDVSGTRACILEGENGFVVPPRNPSALAAAIERALVENARGELGRASRRIAELRFGEERMLSEFLDIMTGSRARANAHDRRGAN